MTCPAHLSSSSPVRSRLRIGAIALVSLALIAAGTPAAFADPDTNIQKPGHVS